MLADPYRVYSIPGLHGLSFLTVADGVEAHIQHLYAYASKEPLPEGCDLLDSRFVYVKRGIAERWIAFSDKKCKEGYELKKEWLRKEFDNGYVFRRLDERAKVFIEYVPAEKAWVPVNAPGYLMINCFWVSGQYKGCGHGKALLQSAIDDARSQGKAGLVTVAGTSKFHFMSDTKWLLRQGFQTVEKLPNGFSLLVLKLMSDAPEPSFKACTKSGECEEKNGLVVYFTMCHCFLGVMDVLLAIPCVLFVFHNLFHVCGIGNLFFCPVCYLPDEIGFCIGVAVAIVFV